MLSFNITHALNPHQRIVQTMLQYSLWNPPFFLRPDVPVSELLRGNLTRHSCSLEWIRDHREMEVTGCQKNNNALQTYSKIFILVFVFVNILQKNNNAKQTSPVQCGRVPVCKMDSSTFRQKLPWAEPPPLCCFLTASIFIERHKLEEWKFRSHNYPSSPHTPSSDICCMAVGDMEPDGRTNHFTGVKF